MPDYYKVLAEGVDPEGNVIPIKLDAEGNLEAAIELGAAITIQGQDSTEETQVILTDTEGRIETHEQEADEAKGYSGTTSNLSVEVAISPASKELIISNDHTANSMSISLNGGSNWITLKPQESLKLTVKRSIVHVKSTVAGAHVPYRIIATDIAEDVTPPEPDEGS